MIYFEQLLTTPWFLPGTGAVLGLLLGALLTYTIQSRLEAKRRKVVERRLSYALLIQVSEAVGRSRASLDRLPEYAKELSSSGVPQSTVAYGAAEFWSALLTEFFNSRAETKQLLDQAAPWLDGVVEYNNSALSGLLMKSADIANLPQDVLPDFQRASMALQSMKTSLGAVVETLKSGKPNLRADLVRSTWHETLKLTARMRDLQTSLAKAAQVSTAEVETLTRSFEAEVLRDTAATVSNSQRMDAATDAARRFLAEKSSSPM